MQDIFVTWEIMEDEMNRITNVMRPRHAGFKIATCAVALLLGWSAPSHAAKWTPLTNPSPSSSGTMMLLTDGTVMVQGNPFNTWMRLTPSAKGSYADGCAPRAQKAERLSSA